MTWTKLLSPVQCFPLDGTFLSASRAHFPVIVRPNVANSTTSAPSIRCSGALPTWIISTESARPIPALFKPGSVEQLSASFADRARNRPGGSSGSVGIGAASAPFSREKVGDCFAQAYAVFQVEVSAELTAMARTPRNLWDKYRLYISRQGLPALVSIRRQIDSLKMKAINAGTDAEEAEEVCVSVYRTLDGCESALRMVSMMSEVPEVERHLRNLIPRLIDHCFNVSGMMSTLEIVDLEVEWLELAKLIISDFRSGYKPVRVGIASRLMGMRDENQVEWGRRIDWLENSAMQFLYFQELGLRGFYSKLQEAGEFARAAARLLYAEIHDVTGPHYRKLYLLVGKVKNDNSEAYVRARLDADIAIFSPSPSHIEHIAAKAVALWQDDVLLSGVGVHAFHLQGLRLASGLNPEYLYQILQNLLKNGLDYRDPEKSEQKIELRFDKTSGYLVYEDNGVGMEAALIRTLYTSTARVRGRHGCALRRGGTGTGWATIKRNCQLLGWKYQIVSVKGQGVTVTLVPGEGHILQSMRRSPKGTR